MTVNIPSFLQAHEKARPPENLLKPFEPKVGAFAKVSRTSGEIKLMQIIPPTSETKKGVIHLRDATSSKDATPEYLALTNSHEVLPFEYRKLPDIFDILKSVGGIQGSNEFFSLEKITHLINQVVAKKIEPNAIPSAGGLRQRIIQIMSTNK